MTPRLLDTQLLLWLAVAPERLPVPLRQPCFQVDARALRRGLLAEGLQELPLAVEHGLAVQHLPWVHRDPFDRLLVAAARESGLQLITADPTLLAYGTEVMACGDV
jgi:PIN domain nuclease of toxin-antitoxin system